MSEDAAISAPEAPVTTGTEGAPAGGESPENAAAQAPADSPAQKAETPKTDEQPEKPGQSRFQRRLDRAYRRAAEAEARAEFVERQIQELRQAQQPKQATGVPRPEDFENVEAYAKAYAEYEKREAFNQYQRAQQQQAAQQAQQQITASWAEKAARGADKYDDFEEKVGEVKPVTPWAIAMMEAENADDIAYYLASNMKEAQRIVALKNPLSQAREIGRLEAKLLADPPKPKTVSSAPAPISPVGAATTNTSTTPSETDDMRTWMSKRQKQVHGR